MPRNYAREYASYQGKPEQIKNRSSRNKARRKMEEMHGADAMKGKDVDHSNGNPLDNSKKNLKLESPSTNRARKTKKR